MTNMYSHEFVYNSVHLFTCMCSASEVYVIRVVSIYIYSYVYMFVDKKNNLNRSLVIDSLFQTFTVGLIVKFKD